MDNVRNWNSYLKIFWRIPHSQTAYRLPVRLGGRNRLAPWPALDQGKESGEERGRMKRGVRPFRQIGLVLAVIILGGLAFGPPVAPTFATDDTVFATPKDPHGVAAGFDPTGTRPRIYVTSCRNPRRAA